MITAGILLSYLGVMLVEGESDKWLRRVGWAIGGAGIGILLSVVNR